jgi:HPt (histidine-containing phosphotransfer) domain-containing protein
MKQDEVKDVQAASDSSTIDHKALENICALQREGQPNILKKVIEQYFSHTPKLVEALREAASTGNIGALQNAAHSLKSSSANLGAGRLATLCKEIEMKARANDVEDPWTRVAEVGAEYDRVRVALEEELKREAS